MPELGTYGSVRGVPSNGHSYRDHFLDIVWICVFTFVYLVSVI